MLFMCTSICLHVYYVHHIWRPEEGITQIPWTGVIVMSLHVSAGNEVLSLQGQQGQLTTEPSLLVQWQDIKGREWLHPPHPTQGIQFNILSGLTLELHTHPLVLFNTNESKDTLDKDERPQLPFMCEMFEKQFELCTSPGPRFMSVKTNQSSTQSTWGLGEGTISYLKWLLPSLIACFPFGFQTGNTFNWLFYT